MYTFVCQQVKTKQKEALKPRYGVELGSTCIAVKTAVQVLPEQRQHNKVETTSKIKTIYF